ncbi:trigger factor [Thermoproteota archaeon]
MKILKSKRKDNTHYLSIEVPEQRLEQAVDRVFQRYSKEAKVPGFRKGKITRSIFEKHYGKGVLMEEALKDAVGLAYEDAVKELKLFVVDWPKNFNIEEYKEGTPLVFSCEVDVKPEVKLGKYKGIKIKKDKVEIKESDVDERINQMREQYAEYKLVESPVQDGDIVRANIKAVSEGQEIPEWTRQNVGLKVGVDTLGKEFDEELISLNKGDSKSITIEYKDDFQAKELAGKTVVYDVEIAEVRQKSLPELTEEFISKISQCKTEQELRDQLRENMEKKAQMDSNEKMQHDLITEIVKGSKMVVQDVLVEREIDRGVERFKESLTRLRMDLDGYLKMANKTMGEIREEMRPDAEQKIKGELVIDAVAEKEAIQVTDEDIETEIAGWNQPEIKTLEDVQNKMKNVDIDSFQSYIKSKKTIDFLVSHSKIN